MKKIPDSEFEIMLIIWEAGERVTADYIMERLDKTWQKTTVLNFLTRLCDRGFLKCGKEGRHNIYESLVDKNDYLKEESRSFFKKVHHNSIISLVSSLYDGGEVPEEDLIMLKRYIGEAE